MPIDLLAPLVAVPVVLLFAFAGCSVPNLYLLPNVLWAGGLQTGIQSIEIAFRLDPNSGESPSNLHPPAKLLTGAELDDFFVNGLNMSDVAPWAEGSPGILTCSCAITHDTATVPVHLLAVVSFDISGDVNAFFQLSRTGTGFSQSDFSLTSAS